MTAAHQSAEAATVGAGVDVEIAVGSFLFWVVSLDDRLRELNGAKYSRRTAEYPQWRFMPGLKLARNAVTHGVRAVGDPRGDRWPQSWPFEINVWRWLRLEELLAGWRRERNAFTARQDESYHQWLDGNDVTLGLAAPLLWLDAITPFVCSIDHAAHLT